MKELPDFSRHLGSDFNPEHLAMMTLSPSIDQCQKRLERRTERTYNGNSHHPASNSRRYTTRQSHPKVTTSSRCGFTTSRRTFPIAHGRRCDRSTASGLINYVSEYAPNFREAIIDWDAAHPRRTSKSVSASPTATLGTLT